MGRFQKKDRFYSRQTIIHHQDPVRLFIFLVTKEVDREYNLTKGSSNGSNGGGGGAREELGRTSMRLSHQFAEDDDVDFYSIYNQFPGVPDVVLHNMGDLTRIPSPSLSEVLSAHNYEN